MADGIGGPKDDVGARQLFEKAAAQSHPGALERMGAFAQSGRGGPQDLNAAKAYYEKAWPRLETNRPRPRSRSRNALTSSRISAATSSAIFASEHARFHFLPVNPHDQAPRPQLQHFARRLRRRPRPEPRQSARRRRHGAAPMGICHPHVPRDARKAKAVQPASTTISRARVRQHRRVDPGPQHVRAGPRTLARRHLEGLVGRQPALSHAGLRAHPPPARSRSRWPGGTTFHFVTDGIHAALRARDAAAGGKDIRLGGGVATIRQYPAAQD